MIKIEMNVCRYLSEGVLTSTSLKNKKFAPTSRLRYRALLQSKLTTRKELNKQEYVIYMN